MLLDKIIDPRTIMEGEEKLRFSNDRPTSQASELRFNRKTVALVEDGQVDPSYQAKAQILNDAIQDIGMGKYQWHLLFVAGFGWFSDNVYLHSFVHLNQVMACCYRIDFHTDCIRVFAYSRAGTYIGPEPFVRTYISSN